MVLVITGTIALQFVGSDMPSGTGYVGPVVATGRVVRPAGGSVGSIEIVSKCCGFRWQLVPLILSKIIPLRVHRIPSESEVIDLAGSGTKSRWERSVC